MEESNKPDRHIISVLLENEAGALARVSSLFSARGYNIETLTVAPTDDPTLSRMTIVTYGPDSVIEQITKQLNKLVDVYKLMELTKCERYVEREVMLVKVNATGPACNDVLRLAEIYKGRVIDVADSLYTIEITGKGQKLDAFLDSLNMAKILEVVRSGVTGIARGDTALTASSSRRSKSTKQNQDKK